VFNKIKIFESLKCPDFQKTAKDLRQTGVGWSARGKLFQKHDTTAINRRHLVHDRIMQEVLTMCGL